LYSAKARNDTFKINLLVLYEHCSLNNRHEWPIAIKSNAKWAHTCQPLVGFSLLPSPQSLTFTFHLHLYLSDLINNFQVSKCLWCRKNLKRSMKKYLKQLFVYYFLIFCNLGTFPRCRSSSTTWNCNYSIEKIQNINNISLRMY